MLFVPPLLYCLCAPKSGAPQKVRVRQFGKWLHTCMVMLGWLTLQHTGPCAEFLIVYGLSTIIYYLMDIVLCFKSEKVDKWSFLHHLFSLTVFAGCFYFGADIEKDTWHVYATIVTLLEAPSMVKLPMMLRLLEKPHIKEHKYHIECNKYWLPDCLKTLHFGALFATLFFVCRFVLLPIYVWKHADEMAQNYFIVVIFVLIMSISAVWMYKLVEGVYKALQKVKEQ